MNYELFLTFERIVRLMATSETDSPKKRRETTAMWMLLNFIAENELTTGADVARRFMIKHPTATQLIDRAVKEGFVVRNQSTKDRRVHYLKLTSHGPKQRQLLGELYDERASRALKYLSDEEHKHLLSLLHKMADGLENERK